MSALTPRLKVHRSFGLHWSCSQNSSRALDIPVRALQRENRSCRSPAAGVERENLCRVVRIRVVNLKPRFHEMLAVGDPGMVQPSSSRIGRSPLIGRLRTVDIVGIGQRIVQRESESSPLLSGNRTPS